jgi:hypothetical protein
MYTTLEGLFLASILCRSGNLIPELPYAAYTCGQHGPVTAWFRLTRPGNVLPVPKTSTLFEMGVICLSQWNSFWVEVKFCLYSYEKLNWFKETAESCRLQDNVFET